MPIKMTARETTRFIARQHDIAKAISAERQRCVNIIKSYRMESAYFPARLVADEILAKIRENK